MSEHIKLLAIDLSKNVFQLHACDAQGRCIDKKRLNRSQLIDYVSNVSQCEIAM